MGGQGALRFASLLPGYFGSVAGWSAAFPNTQAPEAVFGIPTVTGRAYEDIYGPADGAYAAGMSLAAPTPRATTEAQMARTGDGQTALVTGASAGIGVDLAECFAKDGYDLIVTARSADALLDVATRLATAHGVKATPIASDLSIPGGGATLAKAIEERGLGVDVVVNNAGYGIAGAFDGSDRTDQLGMIDLNDRALVELTHLYWPRMLASRRGGVLSVASTASFQPGPLMAVYYASKAFVLSFSEALWKEAEGTGVHVSCLCPGPTASKFRERAGTGKMRLARTGTPMSSAEVAQLGYDGWRANQRVVVTGARNRILATLVPFLPRRALLSLVHNLQSPA